MNKKILLVDDHNLFLDGMKYLLSTYNIKVAAIANDGYEAYKKAVSLKPDIIFMDIYMPECNGIKALKLIKAKLPEVKIMMLTSSDNNEDLKEAIKLGAWGYMLKDVSGEDLVDIINNIEDREAVISCSFASSFFRDHLGTLKKMKKYNSNVKENNLTDRQIEVINQVIKGKTYKEVGKTLHISERTVKYHIGRAITMLHLDNRAQVIAYAVEKGIVENL